MLPAGAGVLLGLLAATALTPLLGGLLYRVSPVDLPTYLTVAAAGMTLAVLVSYVPALLAVRVSPLEVLRPSGAGTHAS